MKHPIVNGKIFAVTLSVASLIAWALQAWAGISFWVSFVIVTAAFLINGVVATIEDKMPGGFNNPERNSPS